jgi:ABC-type uncharacterized transport system YnjBCD ATPase subunit
MEFAEALEARTAELAAALNLAVKPSARIEDLSTGEQQRVEILRVLARQARVLILDEPTAVLTLILGGVSDQPRWMFSAATYRRQRRDSASRGGRDYAGRSC